MRKVLWSGSLKHQGASLTAPQPPSSFITNPQAERPNQGRAACAASFANSTTGGSTDGGVRGVGQHAARPGGGPGESTCHAWPGMPLISPRRSSQWPSADDQQKSGKLSSAQRWCGEMFFFTHMGIFDKWVVSEHCQPKRECVG